MVVFKLSTKMDVGEKYKDLKPLLRKGNHSCDILTHMPPIYVESIYSLDFLALPRWPPPIGIIIIIKDINETDKIMSKKEMDKAPTC